MSGGHEETESHMSVSMNSGDEETESHVTMSPTAAQVL